MKKKLLVFGLIIVVLSILLFLITRKKESEKFYNQVILSNSNTINNNSLPKFLDTILSVGLDAAGLHDIYVVINPMSESAKSALPDYELRAHLREWQGTYYLFIGDIGRDYAIDIISHEIIHIHQYYSGDLNYTDGKVYWGGDEYDLNNTEYSKRPWEEDAFDREKPLSNAIKSILIPDMPLTSISR